LEWITYGFMRNIPKIRGIYSLLGKKEQTVDYYRYYAKVIEDGAREKWQHEFEEVEKQLGSLGLSLKNKSILDISGEPGFFGLDALSVCKSVDVTAFADNVAVAIQERLLVPSRVFDFNSHNLAEIYEGRCFDYIFVRYAIGFCEDLSTFVQHCRQLLNKHGFIYISFSPASRAVCARWMFDDYTYLRQYTKKYLREIFEGQGFTQIAEFELNPYFWSKDMHWFARFVANFYVSRIFDGVQPSEKYQKNLVLILRRDSHA
jgi:SAM-dependent methyltransferase